MSSELRKLMEMAQAGDEQAYQRVSKELLKPVYQYVYLRVGNKQLAEDLAQDVFVKVLQNLEKYRDQGRPMLAYFFTVARNTVIDYWRKKKDIPVDEDSFAEMKSVFAPEDSPQDRAERSWNSNELHKAIATLSEEQQIVITLKHINGYPNSEIAEILGKTEDAVRQVQFRAIRQLRQILPKPDESQL